MCLIFFSLNQNPQYKLIIAGNRDEFYNRRTSKAAFWENHKNILGGCDLEAITPDGTCGTWMGMTTTGRLAFITNYRDPHNINPKAPSRGHLVTDFLLNQSTGQDYLNNISVKASQYNGFNLVVGTADALYYFSNYQSKIQKLDKGFYGLSNHLLDTPWPKVSKGKSALDKEIHQADLKIDSLFEILRDEDRAPVGQLPDTGIGQDRELALSSMFIKTNGYGTRCSTVILIDQQNNVVFQERTYDLTDFSYTAQKFSFQLENSN